MAGTTFAREDYNLCRCHVQIYENNTWYTRAHCTCSKYCTSTLLQIKVALYKIRCKFKYLSRSGAYSSIYQDQVQIQVSIKLRCKFKYFSEKKKYFLIMRKIPHPQFFYFSVEVTVANVKFRYVMLYSFFARARNLSWNFRTICGGQEPSRNRVVVQASLLYRLAESIPWKTFLSSNF